MEKISDGNIFGGNNLGGKKIRFFKFVPKFSVNLKNYKNVLNKISKTDSIKYIFNYVKIIYKYWFINNKKFIEFQYPDFEKSIKEIYLINFIL